MPTSDPVLSLEDVSISYGHVSAVTDVTLTLYAGETLALIGPNGAGKSTLLRGITNQARKATARFASADGTSPPLRRTGSPAPGSSMSPRAARSWRH